MSAYDEGFICPYCLVSLGTPGKLQAHFVEMHQNNEATDIETRSEKASRNSRHSSHLGHIFQVVSPARPKTCDCCNEIIWQDAVICENCHVTLHSNKCQNKYDQPCGPEDQYLESQSESQDEVEPRQSGPPQPSKGLLPFVRRQVAKGRERYINEDFDLDLTYITERIIAMSFPATGMAAAYRNNLKDVARMLHTKHEENYMIFNLSERSYDITNFNNQVLDFGWPDHLAPSLERLSSVCKSIKSWLDSDSTHVAVVHCKGGKGRTGCVIAAFMHYTEICHSAEAALDRFAMKRFYDSKCGGVTQPSQRKYVHYFADLLAGRIDLQSSPVTLQHVIMHGIPNFDGKGGCRAFLKIYENMSLVYTSGLYLCQAEKERVKLSVYGGISLKGEVLIKCFHKKNHGLDPIFRCQFHSAVVGKDLRMVYSKSELDDAFKEKRFDESIRVELLFDNGDLVNLDDLTFADVRSSLLDGKQQANRASSPTNGALEIQNDPLAKRDSYASFRGGYDSGMPGDDPTDMIQLDSPKILHNLRDRSESSHSFNVDPSEIERFTHPQSSEIYTVIHRPPKEKPPKPDMKPTKSSDIPNGSIFSLFDKTDKKGNESSPNRSVVTSSKVPPKRPPPPSVAAMKKSPVSQGEGHPTKPLPLRNPPLSVSPPRDEEDVIYDNVTNDLSSSPGSASPEQVDGHGLVKQIKPAKQSPQHIPLLPQPLKASKPSSNKPMPPTKPTAKPQPSKAALSQDKGNVFQEELTKQLLRHHLKSTRESTKQPQKHLSQKISPKHTHGGHPIARHRPSYAEIQPNQEILVECLPKRTSVPDCEVWGRVKFHKPPPKGDSLGKRSSSSGDLTMKSNSGSDFYSNLDELDITPGEEDIGEGADSKDSLFIQRSHSFSGGDEKLVIKASQANRGSIIPVSAMRIEPDYTNLDYGNLQESGDNMTITSKTDESSVDESQPSALDTQAKRDFIAKVLAGQHNYENTPLPRQGSGDMAEDGPTDEDYMNQLPEGLFHTYTNHEELLEQLRTAHQPIDDMSVTHVENSVGSGVATPSRTRLGSGGSILKFFNFLRQKQHNTIQSGKVSEEERLKTLAPFQISGVDIGNVNRDYEAFLRTSAWGDSPSSAPEVPPQTTSEPTNKIQDEKEPNHTHFQREQSSVKKRPPPKPERPKDIPATGIDTKERSSPITQRKFRRPLLPPTPINSRENQLSTPTVTPSYNRLPSPPIARRHPPLAKKPSAPQLSNESSNHPGAPLPPLPFTKLHSTNSDSSMQLPHVKELIKNHNRHSAVPVLPPPRAKDDKVGGAGGAGGESYHHGHSRMKNPPAKPPPYFDKAGHQQPSESTVKSLMPYWYRPNFTRDEAIEYVQPLDSGLFIVRDSQTVQGGYALTLKISEDHVRRRKKLTEDTPITEDMLVTHFLIQPDPEGVKLQGWNERAFKSLPEFIAHHTMDRLCMPCKLVLPQGAAQPHVRRKPVGVRQALQTGAACNMVYLGSVDVTSPGDDSVLAETVQQLKSLDLSSMNIVTFKASREGITLTDNVNGIYIRRQYPISSVTYCGLDPNGTRWDFPNIQHAGDMLSLKDKPCFGIIYHPQDSYGYSCLVFAEFDSAQPVSSVVNFVQRVMKEHKHSSKHLQN